MKETYNYNFTVCEGGKWYPIDLYLNPDQVEELLEINKKFVDKYSILHFENPNMNNHGILHFHSLMFPDGKIWDTITKGFRLYRY